MQKTAQTEVCADAYTDLKTKMSKRPQRSETSMSENKIGIAYEHEIQLLSF
jgi:hypothetical protein